MCVEFSELDRKKTGGDLHCAERRLDVHLTTKNAWSFKDQSKDQSILLVRGKGRWA